MADLKRLNEFAGIGRDFIGLQFRLTPHDVTRAIFAWLADVARAPTGSSKYVNGFPSES